MKYAYMAAGFVMTGLVGIIFIMVFENVTINNDSEYYVLKEAVKASMYESIDLAYYRTCELDRTDDVECPYGGLKISEEKFVSNCTRRFYDSISGITNKGYKLEFYDIMESPPKVSVIATSKTSSYNIFGKRGGEEDTKLVVEGEADFDIKNEVSAILEYNY